MTTIEILEKAENHFKLNLEYLSFEYKGMPVKVRMNKDHSRNHNRNDNHSEHNLSLVNIPASGSNQNSYFEHKGFASEITFVQQQIFGIDTWELAKEAIENFLYEIDFAN